MSDDSNSTSEPPMRGSRIARLSKLAADVGGSKSFSAVLNLASLVVLTFTFWIYARMNADQHSDYRGSVAAREYANMFQVDLAFVEHPEMRPYFEPDVDPPLDWEALTGDERERVIAMAETMIDFVDAQPRVWTGEPPDVAAWGAYFEALFKRSGVMRQFLASHCDWWDTAVWNDKWDFYSRVPGLCSPSQ